ncbi:putative RNA recognition motif domain-containing protein [Medicago truncatula]|uniref:Putative RNA recognition motif domain-containing protein n=1 Tax=Medicago truncatula TaxID=3880 RepID=A0A396J4K5_MEDTR|nr:putative RNA recognition motif domain-containing protein [Medicago truncatula]
MLKLRVTKQSGSFEVVYNRRSDAFAALKRYNNVLLDGKPMKIEIVGTNSELSVTARVNVSAMNRQRKKTFVMTYCSASVLGVAEFVVTIGLWVAEFVYKVGLLAICPIFSALVLVMKTEKCRVFYSIYVA